MLNGIELPIVGNLTGDPELQFSAQGKAWVRFTVAVGRVTNRDGNKQESTVFVRCRAFGDIAENIAASVKKGNRVIAYGRFEENIWTDREGKEQRTMQYLIDDIGPSLRWAQTPNVERTTRNSGGGGYQSNNSGGGQQSRPAPEPTEAAYSAPDTGDALGEKDNPFF